MMLVLKKIMDAVYGIIKNAGNGGIPINANIASYPDVQSAVQGITPPITSHKRKKLVDKALRNLLDENKICVRTNNTGKLVYVINPNNPASGFPSDSDIQNYYD